MRTVTRRLSSLLSLTRPLALTFIGVILLSLGIALLFVWAYRSAGTFPPLLSVLTLQFIPTFWRGVLLALVGVMVLALGIWQLSGLVVIPLHEETPRGSELVLGYRKAGRAPRITVLSGGAGLLMLARLGEHAERLTCITPLQDPVEYYYRASSLYQAQNVYYVVPTPLSARVYAELDDTTLINVMHVNHNGQLAERHVERLMLLNDTTVAEIDDPKRVQMLTVDQSDGANRVSPVTASLPLTRLATEALRDADAIILGPGSLFESIIPNLLIEEFRTALAQSQACTIFVCNLMTEPGLTTGFGVSDHIRQIKRYGGFTPDYVLVNVQRIDPEVRQLYAAAHQSPVYLSPEEYEETMVLADERISQRQLVVEGSVIVEADLASSVVQYSAPMDRPVESRAVRVLRHDPEKLTTAILALLRRQ
ncbi:MAG: hypothetical protein HC837_11925 [Chloroflexaceae bacterium]|nr:hypothetical protein [Chloroflexaceae bacterium]